ncbi:MAG: DNA gyrase/topoisomerase IV subunit A [Candidatus Spyradocola sp.]|jgi:DNA gyrase subunit A
MPKKRKDDTIERNETILQKPMEEIMHDSMIPYAEHVILERALPRVEDGLKPVQRRILYTMLELGNTPDKPHRKCARIVGDCLGKYHPHGDTSVYDAMVRMAQDFNMRAPLVDGHGNFGSVDGDSAAAMRYTEARMAPLAMELLRDLEKETVSFSLNFDDTLKEPDMLPGRFPNLLVNGASGIAVGLATNIPPHNLGESIDAVIAVMDNPEIPLSEVMKILPAPDFPTGGLLLETEEIRKAYETGRGRLLLRAKVQIEELPSGKKNLVITELPYQVNKSALLEKILKLSEEKKGILSAISDIRDESDRTGMRAVIELKRDADAEKVLRHLYRVSDLQVTFGVNMVAIADGKPMQLPLLELIRRYIAHQKNVVTRRTKYDLDQAKAREHILAGLMIAVDNLDAVLALIRAAKNPKEAREGLMEKFSLTQVQAQAILDMRLQRLTGLEILTLKKEYAEIQRTVARLEGILKSEKKLLRVIREELTDIRDRYADARRTALTQDEPLPVQEEKEEILADPCYVVRTRLGYLKRLSPKVYAKKEESEDATEETFSLKTDEKLLFFTNLGFCYTVAADQIPECRMKDRGIAPAGLLAGLEKGETIVRVLPRDLPCETLLFVTRGGLVKRTQREEFGARKGRAAALNLREGDALLCVLPMEPDKTLLLVTQKAMAIRMDPAEIPVQGRAAGGVKGVALEPGDETAFAAFVPEAGELLLFSDRGYAKRCLLVDYEMQRRGGRGVRTFSFNKNGANGACLVCALPITNPRRLLVVQADRTETTLSTEEVLIENKAGRGKPYIAALMDNVVTSARLLEEET